MIFDCEGEAGCRARERATLAELLAGEGVLLATGGGAVLDPGNRQLLRERGFVVHLHVAPEQQLERLGRARTPPPLARAGCGARPAPGCAASGAGRGSRCTRKSPTCASIPRSCARPMPPCNWRSNWKA